MIIPRITGATILHWLKKTRVLRSRRPQQLRLRETLTLGERRFVAVIEFDRQQFLIGGTANSVAMLANLGPPGSPSRTADEIPTWDLTPGMELSRNQARAS